MVRDLPRAVLGDIQRARAADDDRNAIPILVRGRKRRLHLLVGALDSIRIDCHVLGCGRDRHADRDRGKGAGRRCRIHAGENKKTGADRELGKQQPGPAPAQQPGQQWQWQPVDERRPEKLEGVSEAHPGKGADRAFLQARLVEPGRQRRVNERERQPARKAEEEQREDLVLQVMPPVLGGLSRHAPNRNP